MSEPLTDAELDEIERRAAAATAGPWRWGLRDPDVIESATDIDPDYQEPRKIIETDSRHHPPGDNDGDFTIARRVDVPRLVAEVLPQRAHLKRIHAALIGQCSDQPDGRFIAGERQFCRAPL